MRNSKSRGKVKSLITTFLHHNASKNKHVVALVLALIYIVQMNNKKTHQQVIASSTDCVIFYLFFKFGGE